MRRNSILKFLRFTLSVILPIAILSPVSAQIADQPPSATFRSEVTEVRVTFSTTDQKNRVVSTVQPTDFAIVDQGRVIREFRSFTRSGYTRLQVTILVDGSDSLKPRLQQELSSVTELLGPDSGLPEDALSVVSFHGVKPITLCQGNCRALDLGAQFSSVANESETPLYDSMVFASQQLGQTTDVHARKILVVFSDGEDTISIQSLSDVINSALEGDVAIYSIDLSAAPQMRSGSAVLRWLAANSGGRYFTAGVATDKVLNAILEDFHATYTVAYKLPNPAEGFHLLRILPTHDLGLQFHCRLGYYYPNKF